MMETLSQDLMFQPNTDDVGSKQEKSYDGDFEPRPNISAYGDE